MKYNEDQIENVIAQCKKGDMSQFDMLYEHFYSTVYYTAYHFFNDQAKAQDALQNTFIEVFYKIASLENPKAFSAWIRRITYRKCLNMIAYEKKDSLYYIQHADTDIPSLHSKGDEAMKTYSLNDLYQLIIESFEALDERKRMIGYLKFFECYSAKEISEEMGINYETVNTNVRRIRIYIKDYLAKRGYCGDDFLSVAAVSTLSINYQDYITQLPEVEHGIFKIAKKKTNIKTHSKAMITFGSIAVITCVALSIYVIINRNALSSSVQALFHITAKIENITYDHNITNTPIALHVSTTSKNYDELLVNHKKIMSIKANGKYEVVLIKDNEVIDKESIHIRNFDTDEPYMSKKVENEDNVTIYFNDNIAIDPSFLEVYANDVLQKDIKLNTKNNTITLTKDVSISYHIRTKDTASNISEFYINFKY